MHFMPINPPIIILIKIAKIRRTAISGRFPSFTLLPFLTFLRPLDLQRQV